MFLELPFDVILLISEYLNSADKFNLATTCLILNRSVILHSELSLPKNSAAVTQVLTRFKNGQLNGNQVKTLNIPYWLVLSSELCNLLPIIFPNLTELNQGHCSGEYCTASWEPWKDTITRFDGGSDGSSPLLELLKTNTFPRLTYLGIGSPVRFNPESNDEDPTLQLLVQIKNAPLLEKLTLRTFVLDIAFFEKLHDVCPRLKSLVLDTITIFIRDNPVNPNAVVPAQLLSLEITGSIKVVDGNCRYLEYILLKYPHLHKLDLSFGYNVSLEVLLSLNIRQRLENFENRPGFLNTSNTKYFNAGENFLKRLPNTIQVLRIRKSNFNNVMTGLVQSEVRPRVLEIIYYNQHFEVQDNPPCIESYEDFLRLKDFPTLKKLHISIDGNIGSHCYGFTSTSIVSLCIELVNDPKYKKVYIDSILNAFPSLMRLEIKSRSNLVISADSSIHDNFRKVHPDFSEFIFAGFSFDGRGRAFIQEATPNLKKISFSIHDISNEKEDSRMDDSEHMLDSYYQSPSNPLLIPIDLSTCHLNSLSLLLTEIRNSRITTKLYIEVITDHRYLIRCLNKPSAHKSFEKVLTIPPEDSSEKRLTITCGSLKQIKFNDANVFCLDQYS